MIEQFQTSDGYRFYVRKYPAVGSPRGRLVFVHGIRSHGGWYERSSLALAEAGYEVHFLDRRGSGLNTARRGDCPNFRRVIRDVREYVYDLRRMQSFLPIYLAGISWGGKTVLGVEAMKSGLVNGVALLCPGLKPAISPPLARRLRIVLASQIRPDKLFDIPLNAPELFTADTEAQRFVNEDIHGLTQATARFLFHSFRFDLWLKKNLNKVKTNVLLMLADRDRIINNAETRRYLNGLSCAKSISVIDYPGCHHTLEFERDQRFVNDLIAWMERVG